MKLEPIDDNLVVRKIDQETRLPSGIVLIDVSEKPEIGEVVAVGPGRMEVIDGSAVRLPMTVTVGDMVLLQKFGGHTVKIGADEFIAMRERDVFAILRNE